jgi:hypothetical protein
MFGFILMAKGETIEFYVKDDRDLRDTWIKHLRHSVVFLDLKENYEIHELLGRGNFAKVHRCTKFGENG